MRRTWRLACAVLTLVACKKAAPALPDLSAFPTVPDAATLHRLSSVQYTNSIHDLLSSDIVVPTQLEPDVIIDGFVQVGMSTATISPTGVSEYEAAALSVAGQAVATEASRAAFFPCAPASVGDSSCLTTFVTSFGKRAWRRPLTNAEISALVSLGVQSAMALGDPWQGLAAAMAEILQSPYFLFRVELGEPDPSGTGMRYSNHEMAGRVAAFLTASSVPDTELLAAADRGELTTTAGLRAQVERILASPAARAGVANFFTELFSLKQLANLPQDPSLFPAMSADLGTSAQQETLDDLESLVLDEDGDYRTFFTGRSTMVNRRLAAVYDIPAPSITDFAGTQLPVSGARRGFLGSVSFLALQAHPTTTSPVLRGKFVRTVLLCDIVPPPPVGVNTGLAPVTQTIRTMRERDAAHLEEGSTCNACHSLMDPIGLGFENFDAIGVYRSIDGGEPIDASGNLDGVYFSGPVQLSEAIVNSAKFAPCVAHRVYEYATGVQPGSGDYQLLKALGSGFVTTNYRIKALMEMVALSSGFRQAGASE
jgi:hypothetical protein